MDDIKALREKVKDLKVLFVDDEEDIREGTGIFLNKFFEDVTICSDGEEALKIFKKEGDFNLIISDILMPNMDGIEMMQEIRKINPDIFAIFLTASRQTGEIDSKLANITLQKPLSFKNMIFLMQKLGDMKW
ncbi:MAG: response regulator [Sulfurimonas sp.]|nr:response regulator [Sulfurimonas sp.]